MERGGGMASKLSALFKTIKRFYLDGGSEDEEGDIFVPSLSPLTGYCY